MGAPASVSPDGKLVFSVRGDNKAFLYPVDGGEPRAVEAYEAGQWPGGWSKDGRFLFLYSTEGMPIRVWRVDLGSGQRELWREVAPADANRGEILNNFVVSEDGRSYAYSYSRSTSELYVVEGMEVR